MGNPRDVEIDVTANDRTDRGTKSAARNLDRLDRKVKAVDRSTDRMSKTLAGLEGKLRAAGGGATRAAVGFAKAAGALAAVAANAPALGGLVPVLTGVAAQGAPAAAALAVFGAVAGTVFGQVLKASADGATGLDRNMSRAVKSLDALKDAWARFVKRNNPQILDMFTRGFRLLKELLPSLQPLFDAGLAGAQRFLGFLERKAAEGKIQAFLQWLGQNAGAGIKRFGDATGPAVEAVKRFFDVWRENQDAIDKARTALAGIAIVAGIASGGWLIALGGAVALATMHWDDLKGAVRDTRAWFDRGQGSAAVLKGALEGLQGAAGDLYSWVNDRLNPSLQRAASYMSPALSEAADDLSASFGRTSKTGDSTRRSLSAIGDVVNDLLIPAFAFLGNIQIAAVVDQLTSMADAINYLVLPWFRILARQAVGALNGILIAADIAFGWIPGIGPKLHTARLQFDQFVNDVNRSLDGIHDEDVNVRVHYTSTGTPVAGNGSQKLAAGGKAIALAAGRDVTLADSAGRSTQPPSQISVAAPAVNNSFVVLLDGEPVRAIVRQEIQAARQADARALRFGGAYA